MVETTLPLVEPDLVGVWRKNVWLFGLRMPFSMVLFSWVTMASALAPEFHLDRYLLTLLGGFFGLVVGAHYIDITASKDKYLPYFPGMNRAAVKVVGILSVLVGIGIGVYMSLLYSLWFLVFVVAGGFFALFYPIEKPRWLHTYPGFGVAWGFMPILASYYIQGLQIDLVGLGLATFLGITVVQMHHMAVLTNEKDYNRDVTKNARYLLKLHRASAYAIGLVLLIARLI
ncbi:MAG TPA: hypothetical protein VFE96_00655 [Candidatus Bathyarchaeia archaeon]|jgi:uncharacterized membrane protein|nr:hypothetical protein [Candidatus Bathyarchaeia archaeon]